MRNDLARPREGFRSREGEGDRKLETGTCAVCKGETYRTGEGTWLHWSTLEAGCPRKGDERPAERPFGPRMDERVLTTLDSPERGLSRAYCFGSYRRPSWEWMGCTREGETIV